MLAQIVAASNMKVDDRKTGRLPTPIDMGIHRNAPIPWKSEELDASKSSCKGHISSGVYSSASSSSNRLTPCNSVSPTMEKKNKAHSAKSRFWKDQFSGSLGEGDGIGRFNTRPSDVTRKTLPGRRAVLRLSRKEDAASTRRPMMRRIPLLSKSQASPIERE
jgi:hypothetical protein